MFSQIMRTADPLVRLNSSRFRSRFHLSDSEKRYAAGKGIEALAKDAFLIIEKRLSEPEKNGFRDGRQTPWNGVIFKAQHATATCCRKCMFRWHRIRREGRLRETDKGFILKLILRWIQKEISAGQR